jgi:hypothetical protein
MGQQESHGHLRLKEKAPHFSSLGSALLRDGEIDDDEITRRRGSQVSV